MNRLSVSKQTLVLSQLVEGNSICSIERLTGVTKKAMTKLLVAAGERAVELLDRKLVRLNCRRVEADEIWAYVGKKQKRVTADDDKTQVVDQYTFTAMDADTKVVFSHVVGKRDAQNTLTFIRDIGERVTGRIQLTTDAFAPCAEVDQVFGAGIDYAQVVKVYESDTKAERRYSPAKIVRTKIQVLSGNPVAEFISTSYIERQNLTMRMWMRRFTRMTNAFSKKLENLEAAAALHFFHYNFMRIHETLRVTPAMEAKIENHLWS